MAAYVLLSELRLRKVNMHLNSGENSGDVWLCECVYKYNTRFRKLSSERIRNLKNTSITVSLFGKILGFFMILTDLHGVNQFKNV